ncbi:MAG: thiazole biosynthesis adenylyltransferase ThiF [Planctomycetes bacterium]|nr:thiazole biosynthesis adenylyltransferase ThiF [Planctomycetota bacterium]
MDPGANLDDRYSRQILFRAIGEEGQRKLSEGSVIVIGCGALGSMIANNVVRSGVGRVVLVDRDRVELSNIPRQNLFDEEDARSHVPKAFAAEKRLREINSETDLRAEVVDVRPDNIEGLIADVDVILDGTDNMETRFLINDVAVKRGKPWIYGAVAGSSGMTMNVVPGATPCLTCLFEEIPPPGTVPTANTDGVLNSVTAIVASLQTTEAMKHLLGGLDLRKGLLYIDVWDGYFKTIHAERREDCTACGKRDFRFLGG